MHVPVSAHTRHTLFWNPQRLLGCRVHKGSPNQLSLLYFRTKVGAGEGDMDSYLGLRQCTGN